MKELYACGFNAHGQLKHASEEDVHTFERIASDEDDIEVLQASWSRTVVRQNSTLHLLGHFCPSPKAPLAGPDGSFITLPTHTPIQSTFSSEDHSVLGFVSSSGSLYLLDESNSSPCFRQNGDEESPRLSFIAIAATGRTCLTFLQSPATQMIHVLEFARWNHFLSWYRDPASYSRTGLPEVTHHQLNGRTSSLTAGAVSFTLTTASGEVYTWTPDARHHRCLGRIPSTDYPAERPALVDSLGGMAVVKVAQGGWVSVALTKDSDAYLWGRERPADRSGRASEAAALEVLPGSEDGEIRLVSVGEGMDVLDVSAGGGHAAVLDENGAVWMIGENDNGQVGGGANAEGFVRDWIQVESLMDKKVTRIWCGDRTSFALVDS